MAAPGMPESRSGAFDTGLNADAQRFQSKVPVGFVQKSVLQQAMPSGNGMSTADYERVMPINRGGRPVILPSKNGTSSQTWDQNTYMRLNNENVI